MMLPAGERLCDDRVRPAGKAHDGREIILKLGLGLPAVGRGVNRERVAKPGEIPAGQIEKMDRFLENPIPNPSRVVAPAVRTQPVGASPQFDQRIERIADRAGIDEPLDLAP